MELDEEALADGYSLIRRMYDEKVVEPVETSYVYNSGQAENKLWINGQVGCMYFTASSYGQFENEHVDMEPHNPPILADARISGFSATPAQVWSVANNDNQAEAIRFVDYILNDPEGIETLGDVRSVPASAPARELLASKKMFTTDPDVLNSLKVTFKYVFISIPLKITFALIITLILNMNLRGMNFYRTIYYLPSILDGSVAVSILWRNLFETNGVINHFLANLGIKPIAWLTSPKIALTTLSLLSVWQFGSSMVFFLAGLKQISQELYEAAAIDGAGKVRSFFKITLPLLTPIVFFNLVMQTINAFQEFTASFIVTNGGPLKSTYMYGLLLYQNGFAYMKMGYASALSWVLFIIILAFTMLIFKSSAYWTFYSDGGKS